MANTTLYPTADAHVKEADPTTNFGTMSTLRTQTRIGVNIRCFLKFDGSGLPAGAIITLAKLRCYCSGVYNLVAGVTDVQARRVADDSWLEVDPDGITWNNQPDYGVVEDTQVPVYDIWIEWDVTSFVQDELADDKVVSLCLKIVTENYDGISRYSYCWSKEYDNLDPELYIEYIVPPTSPLIGKPLVAPIIVGRPKIR